MEIYDVIIDPNSPRKQTSVLTTLLWYKDNDRAIRIYFMKDHLKITFVSNMNKTLYTHRLFIDKCLDYKVYKLITGLITGL
jgi:hypothetical protein